jgi:acetyltransferase-like isoleucine patch superfamily enzyme
VRVQSGKSEDGMKAILPRVRSSIDQALSRLRGGLLRSAWAMDIGPGCRIAMTATLDKTNPRGVHIGANTEVAWGADVRAHDSAHVLHVDTWIGERCHIGVGAVICPGVKVGDGCIVAPGAVVMGDIAAGCVVAGNPARVVEKDVRTGRYGVRLDAAVTVGLEREAAAPDMADDAARNKIGVLS